MSFSYTEAFYNNWLFCLLSCADLTYFALHIVYPCMFTVGIPTTHTQPINVCKHMFTHFSIWFFLDSFLKSPVPSPVSYYNSIFFYICFPVYCWIYFLLCWIGNTSSKIDKRMEQKWDVFYFYFFCNNSLLFNLHLIYFIGFCCCCWHC